MKLVQKPLRRKYCVVVLYMLQYMHLSIYIYVYIYNIIMPTSSTPGPRFVIIRELNRSLMRRDNRCGTHQTTATVVPRGICYYILLLLYAYIPTTRARGRRPVRNVSSTSDARGAPAMPPETIGHTLSEIVEYNTVGDWRHW